MTPQEKAKELYDKYYDAIREHWNAGTVSKQCALIAVDEIIDCTKNGLGITKFSKEYWIEVKEEIEKL